MKKFIKEPMLEKKLKIGFVIDDGLDRLDGVQRYVITLGEYMKSLGHEVHYLCGQTTRSEYSYIHSLSKNFSVRFNGGNQLTIPLPTRKSKLKAKLDELDLDILHIQTPFNPFLGSKIVSLASGKIPIVGTFHILPYGNIPKIGSFLLGLVQQKVLKQIDYFYSVSSPANKFAKRYFKIDSEIMPNPVDISKYKPNSPRHNATKTIKLIYINRLIKRKGCHQLLKAINYGITHNMFNPDFTLDVCSDGYQRNMLEKYVSNNGLEKIVRFTGYISDKKKCEMLQNSQIAVFPSIGGESFGIVLIEAMAANVQVVMAGDNPGYRSVLRDNSVLFNPFDTKRFAHKLAKFINNAESRKLVNKSQQKQVLQYDVKSVATKILNRYILLQNQKNLSIL